MHSVRPAKSGCHAGGWPAFLRGGIGSILILPALLLTGAFCFSGAALAEGIGGYLDLGYSDRVTTSENAAGTSRTESDSFTQRYNLRLSRTLYPYLRLHVNGLFEKTDSTSMTNAVETESTLTRVQPFIDLTLRSPVYTASGRYVRREDTVKVPGIPSITTVNETSTGIFGWRPEDFPRFEMRAERTNTYDEQRASRDMTRDLITLTMEYEPAENLAIRYLPSYVSIKDHLSTLETEDLRHAGRVDYSGRLLRDRILFSTSYNVVRSEKRTSVSGTGLIDIILTPFSGLFAIDDTPADGALAPNTALIDGDLTASAGVNIGLPPITGDTRERNIGLDFFLPEEVNTLFVWVDRDLPPAIADSFTWDVYTSTDNQVWNLHATVVPALFGTFESRFEIAFSPVTTRYIKVVVKPLSPAVPGASGFPDILVTELQAFSRKPAEEVRGTRRASSQLFNFDGTVLLLNNPNLYYELSYYYAESEPPSQRRYTLSNGLNVSHRFSAVFTGSARVAREDFAEPTIESGVAHVVNSTLGAAPLKTLRHNLTYSGRFEQKDDKRSDTNSLFLYNYAEIYRGINVKLSGGVSRQNQETGQSVDSTIYSALTNILPHRALNLSYFFSRTNTERSGGGKPDSKEFTDRTDVSATYNPFPTLYLVASLTELVDQERRRTFQNYAFNWSPFPSGALQFAFAYSESLASERNTLSRIITPTVRWNIGRTSYLTASYQITKGESDVDKADSRTFSTNLRIAF